MTMQQQQQVDPRVEANRRAASLIWAVLLDEKGKEEARKLIAEAGWEKVKTLLPHYLEQAGLQNAPPAERVAGYRTRPLGNWMILRQKYRKQFDEDLRDFRKLDPEGGEQLEMVLIMLESALQQQEAV